MHEVWRYPFWLTQESRYLDTTILNTIETLRISYPKLVNLVQLNIRGKKRVFYKKKS